MGKWLLETEDIGWQKYQLSIPNLKKKEVSAGQWSIKNVSFLFWTLIFAVNAFSSWMDSFDIIHVSSFASSKQGRILFPLEQGQCNKLSNKFHAVQTGYMCKQHFSFYPYTDNFFCLVFHQEGGHNKVLNHLCCKCPNVSTTQLIAVLALFWTGRGTPKTSESFHVHTYHKFISLCLDHWSFNRYAYWSV